MKKLKFLIITKKKIIGEFLALNYCIYLLKSYILKIFKKKI